MNYIISKNFLMFIILFLVGQAYYDGTNFICLSFVIAAINGGYKLKYTILASIVGVILGGYISPAASVIGIYQDIVTLFVALILLRASKVSVKHSTREWIARIGVTITYISAGVVLWPDSKKGVIYGFMMLLIELLIEDGLYKIISFDWTSLTKEEFISICINFVILLYCIPSIDNQFVSVKMTIVMFMALWITYSQGMGFGCIMVLSQFVAATGNINEYLECIITTLFAILAVYGLSKAGKFISAISFGIVMGLSDYVLVNFTQWFDVLNSKLLGASISAAFIFMCVPACKLKLFSISDRNISDFENADVRNNTRFMLDNVSHELAKLSTKIQKGCTRKEFSSSEITSDVIEGVALAICENCDRKYNCWNDNYSFTIDELERIVNDVCVGQDIDYVSGFCLKSQLLVDNMKNGIISVKRNIAARNNMLQLREAMGTQMREISNILSDYSTNMFEPVCISYGKKLRLIKLLYKNGIIINGISILSKNDGRYIVRIKCRSISEEGVPAKRVASIISHVVSKKMVLQKGQSGLIQNRGAQYSFVEKTNYKVMTGVAAIPKGNKAVNGDTYSFMQTRDKNVIMILADGMGTGQSAANVSGECVDIMESFIEAGFRTEASISLLNSIMVNENGDIKGSSIDICKINRYTGICNFSKVGAAPSFIVRNHNVEVVQTQSCLVGVVDTAWCDTVVKKLYNGNFIVMCSDGVIECFGENGISVLMDFLENIKTVNAQEIADEILNFCLKNNTTKNEDDMTVLVATVWT